MKCREFEAIVMDLARGGRLEPATRRIADGHAVECSQCAARLAREREVMQALDALAESTRECRAPDRIEASLLRAFADRRKQPPARRVAPAWLALAAAGVLLAIVAASSWLRPARVSPTPAMRVHAPVAASAPPPVPASPHQAVARRVAARHVVRKPAQKVAAGRQAAEREVVTQFYPLEYAAHEGDFDRDPVVRVRVPRTMLAPFGLPVDPDRASEPVQADVVLDDTGMARAIRFVALARN